MKKAKSRRLTDARILLVEDHDRLAESLTEFLAKEFAGCLLWRAKTGEEAIEKTLLHRPDVIVMDVGLPGIDGIEATQAIRRHIPTARIIVWSLQPHPALPIRAMEAGAHVFLDKAAGTNALIEAVSSLLPTADG
jgi:two-component system, NarL family, invasion response regulator UvrY